MNDINFIIKVLKISSENDIKIGWSFERDIIVFNVDCSDLFSWGSADCEDITEENLPILEQSIKDINIYGSRFTPLAGDLFCARINKQRPQGAFYSYIDKGFWHLFDECGKKRETGYGNPYEPGEYKRSSRLQRIFLMVKRKILLIFKRPKF